MSYNTCTLGVDVMSRVACPAWQKFGVQRRDREHENSRAFRGIANVRKKMSGNENGKCMSDVQMETKKDGRRGDQSTQREFEDSTQMEEGCWSAGRMSVFALVWERLLQI